MSLDIELLDSISFFLFALIFYFLGVLSKKLGEVLGMRKYYSLYYMGIFFALSASIITIVSLMEYKNMELFGYGYVFFSVGLTFSLIASIKYWGWLLKEFVKG